MGRIAWVVAKDAIDCSDMWHANLMTGRINGATMVVKLCFAVCLDRSKRGDQRGPGTMLAEKFLLLLENAQKLSIFRRKSEGGFDRAARSGQATGRGPKVTYAARGTSYRLARGRAARYVEQGGQPAGRGQHIVSVVAYTLHVAVRSRGSLGTDDQPQDGKDAWPRNTGRMGRWCQCGDRIGIGFFCCGACPNLALLGLGTMCGLSPKCAPQRTSAGHFEFTGSRHGKTWLRKSRTRAIISINSTNN
jgi:hypothetical protein